MVLFSRETKILRRRQNELQTEIHRLISTERRLSDRLRNLVQRKAELDADKADLDDGD